MKLYKFRPLNNCNDLDRVLSIIEDGFYCCNFLDFNDANEGVFLNSQNISNVDLIEKLRYMICSFSEEKALCNQLMWGHYANAGMGIAIEIEVYDEYTHQLKEVKYGASDRYTDVIEILTNKSKEWCYESEWRYISKNGSQFYKCNINKIYFGTPYKKLGNYQEIKNMHRKLREFLRFTKLLKKECDEKSIETCDYNWNT